MDIFSLLDELRVIAQNGLQFSSDPHDRERYGRLMSLVTQHYSELLEVPEETTRARFLSEMGYITRLKPTVLPPTLYQHEPSTDGVHSSVLRVSRPVRLKMGTHHNRRAIPRDVAGVLRP